MGPKRVELVINERLPHGPKRGPVGRRFFTKIVVWRSGAESL